MLQVERAHESLALRIEELVTSDEVQLPPLPEVAVKARELLARDDTGMGELGQLLTRDPGIAAALLRLANSVHFGGMGRVDTVQMAIQRIGMKEVGAMVTALCLKGHFDHADKLKKELLTVLWDHSVTTAFAARRIADQVGVNGEKAFLGGLLHDAGKVLVLAAIDRLEEEDPSLETTRPLLTELMDQLHAELGHHMLSSWNIEDEIAEIAKDHQGRSEDASDLLLSVQAANLITQKLGFHLDPLPDLVLTEHEVVEDLGLSDLEIATLMIDMEDHLQEMKSLF